MFEFLKFMVDRAIRGSLIKYEDSLFVVPDIYSLTALDPQHESWFWKYVNVSTGSIVFDVGAHIGKYTITLAKRVGKSGTVVAIEPDPINFKFLYVNCIIDDMLNQVRLYSVAAYSEDNKWLKFYKRTSVGHSLVLREGAHGILLVKTCTLDSIANELALNRVDLMKIDVEGTETEVLKGSVYILSEFRPVMVAEVWRYNSKNLLEQILKLSYTVYLIKEVR